MIARSSIESNVILCTGLKINLQKSVPPVHTFHHKSVRQPKTVCAILGLIFIHIQSQTAIWQGWKVFAACGKNCPFKNLEHYHLW